MFNHEPLEKDVVEPRLGHPIDVALRVGLAKALESLPAHFHAKMPPALRVVASNGFFPPPHTEPAPMFQHVVTLCSFVVPMLIAAIVAGSAKPRSPQWIAALGMAGLQSWFLMAYAV